MSANVAPQRFELPDSIFVVRLHIGVDPLWLSPVVSCERAICSHPANKRSVAAILSFMVYAVDVKNRGVKEAFHSDQAAGVFSAAPSLICDV